jgi:DNA-binding GntR family transcriptional regulator
MSRKALSAPSPEFHGLAKLQWAPLQETVYKRLRESLMLAGYAPGQRLTVRATAEAMQVSPMPIRAAFARLVAEKVVIQLENGTIAIPPMTKNRFKEIISLRVLLEGRATEFAARRIKAEQIPNLKSIADALTSAAKRDDAEAYLRENQHFKFTIYQIADQPVLMDLIERLWLQIGPFMRFYAKGIRQQLSIDEQEAIVSALRRRDADAARRAAEKDITKGAEFLEAVAEFAAEPAESVG